jgi:hypothetical protein
MRVAADSRPLGAQPELSYVASFCELAGTRDLRKTLICENCKTFRDLGISYATNIRFGRFALTGFQGRRRSSTMNPAGELKLWILTLAVRHSSRTRAAACAQMGRRCFPVGR